MEYIITEEQAGKTVKDILRRDLNLSSTLLRRLKTVPDGITLDGARVTVRAVVKAGQRLCLKTEDEQSSENILPTEGDVDILFESRKEVCFDLTRPLRHPKALYHYEEFKRQGYDMPEDLENPNFFSDKFVIWYEKAEQLDTFRNVSDKWFDCPVIPKVVNSPDAKVS